MADSKGLKQLDADYENMELRSEIVRHHRDFADISALCTLVRNNRIEAGFAINTIMNIVG